MIVVIFSWIIFSLVAGYIGQDRKIGLVTAFCLSLFLSPLIGLIVAFSSERNQDVELRDLMKQKIEDERLHSKSNNQLTREEKAKLYDQRNK